jgi:hypothetical protein
MLSRALPRDLLCSDGWPTFTVFVKVGIHAAGHHGVEYKSRMELESSTQNQNNKLSASVVPTFTKNVKVGHPSFPRKYIPKKKWLPHPWRFKGGHHGRIPLEISVFRLRLNDVTNEQTVCYVTIKILR